MIEFQDEQPDVLSDDPCLVNVEENKFVIQLKKIVTERKELFLLEQYIRQTRNTFSIDEEIDTMFQVVEYFISKF